MLTSLQVRDFAIIDCVEVEFDAGMTALTGETGAGKSILVDALGLVLGERGGGGLVRRGAKRAEFTAEFDLATVPDAQAWLEAHQLDLDGDCNLRRVISAEGRSRAFINSVSVPLQSLKTLGELLIDIHGQHFHQSLVRPAIQRELLDHFGGLAERKQETSNLFNVWHQNESDLRELLAADSDRTARMELLQFQVNEIQSLDLADGELASLINEGQKLRNGGQILEGVSRALNALYDADEANAQSFIGEAGQSIDSLAGIDEKLQPVAELLRDAEIQLKEAVDSLRRYADDLDMDPTRQEFVEERLDAIYNVARKHRIDADDIGTFCAQIEQQLDDLTHAEERSVELQTLVNRGKKAFLDAARKLSVARKKAAAQFSSDVTNAMSDLGMPGGAFEAVVSERDPDDPRPWGIDDIEYRISANPGQELQPLAKIASGGELSRMSLAIQVIGSDGSRISTMVFDEVDSGVGGGVAEMVGIQLRALGNSRQVLCVTHLPQVASQADNHFRIAKISDGKATRTTVTSLRDDERIEEIARMLGGVDITRRTRDHAEEMLKSAKPKVRKNRSA